MTTTDEAFSLPIQLVGGPGNLFLLHVRNDAMVGGGVGTTGIAVHDWLVVRQPADAKYGDDIVAVMSQGDCVLRLAEDVAEDETTVGKVLALLRQL